jgi:hypothetical protein
MRENVRRVAPPVLGRTQEFRRNAEAGGRRVNETHCQSHTPEYRAWYQMNRRCHDPRHGSFNDYGARGITVCDRWRESFLAFLSDLGPRPSTRHSLDRRDNNRGYEPGNCRWATPKEQANNTRRTRRITVDGVTRTLKEWADLRGVRPSFILTRIVRLGWSPERAVTQPAYRPLPSLEGYVHSASDRGGLW